MYNSFKIASWNVCLGIANKKDTATETLAFEGIDICCIQEADIPKNFLEENLNCNNFVLELEMNNDKKRSGIYLSKNIKYKWRKDLEKENMHIVIVDVYVEKCISIVSVYRSFRPIDMTPGKFFEVQLEILAKAQCSITLVQ